LIGSWFLFWLNTAASYIEEKKANCCWPSLTQSGENDSVLLFFLRGRKKDSVWRWEWENGRESFVVGSTVSRAVCRPPLIAELFFRVFVSRGRRDATLYVRHHIIHDAEEQNNTRREMLWLIWWRDLLYIRSFWWINRYMTLDGRLVIISAI
jgi:hypothetical protein